MTHLQVDGAACEQSLEKCDAGTSILLFHSARFLNPCNEIFAKLSFCCVFLRSVVTCYLQ